MSDLDAVACGRVAGAARAIRRLVAKRRPVMSVQSQGGCDCSLPWSGIAPVVGILGTLIGASGAWALPRWPNPEQCWPSSPW